MRAFPKDPRERANILNDRFSILGGIILTAIVLLLLILLMFI
jgi:hypothetical protein